MNCVIVFTPDKDHTPWCFRFMHRKFRHCFVIVRCGDVWVSVDSVSAGIEVQVHEDYTWRDLVQFHRKNGDIAMALNLTHLPTDGISWRWLSCVEVVKRVIGVRGWWIWTPYQLYNHIITKGVSKK